MNKRDTWIRIGLSKRDGVFEWINGSKFTENRKILNILAPSNCIGYAINSGDTFSTAKFYNVGCSTEIQYICEKRLRTKGRTIVKPRMPKTQVNVVENTPTTFQSTTAGSSNTALLAGCISAACHPCFNCCRHIFDCEKEKKPRLHKETQKENRKGCVLQYNSTAAGSFL